MKVGFGIIYIVLFVVGLAGWIVNLCKVISAFAANTPIDTLFLGRIIGIPVAIVGAVLGWF